MAIIQISRIQQRTGNLADMPQLSAGELGFASDVRRIFIGNDTVRTGDPAPNNTEILTQYSPISMGQVANIVNVQNYDVVQYDALTRTWINRSIYLQDTTVHGNLQVTGTILPISNANIKLTGGTSGQFLQTDGTGNLSWNDASGGGGGGSFTIAQITTGANTVLTVSNVIISNGDPFLIGGVQDSASGNMASVLNGTVYYAGNVDGATGNLTVYANANLTGTITVSGTYVPNSGTLSTRLQAAGSNGAVQFSDGLGHFIAAAGFSFNTTASQLTVPNINVTSSNSQSIFSVGGANLLGNLRVGGNAIIAGDANIAGNANVTGNITVTGTIQANNTSNVVLGNVANLHIYGGTTRVAIATPTVSMGGAITGLVFSNIGLGYTTAPVITFNGTNTTQATATIALYGNGAVDPSSLVITNAGSGYLTTPAPTVTFTDPPAEFLRTDGYGNLTYAKLGDLTTPAAGANGYVQYNVGPNNVFGGSANFQFNASTVRVGVGNATSNTQIGNGVVTLNKMGNGVSLVGNDNASNYSLTLPSNAGNNYSALAGTVSIVGGQVTNIAVANIGSGYISPPQVTILGANATPATATAAIDSLGRVTTVTITGSGAGYVTATATFSAPPVELLNSDGRGNLGWSNAYSVAGSFASPTGSITMWPNTTPPPGYLVCDGSAISKTAYSALFAVLGTTYGGNATSSTFNLPDFRNRVPIGTGGLYNIGTTGGSKDAVVIDHTHTSGATTTINGANINLSHSHGVSDPGHYHAVNAPSGGVLYIPGLQTASMGGIGGRGLESAEKYYYDFKGVKMISQEGTGVRVNSQTLWANFGGAATTTITINNSGVSGTNLNLPPYLAINFIIKT